MNRLWQEVEYDREFESLVEFDRWLKISLAWTLSALAVGLAGVALSIIFFPDTSPAAMGAVLLLWIPVLRTRRKVRKVLHGLRNAGV